MNENGNTFSPDPYLMTVQQKRDFFERTSHSEYRKKQPMSKASSVSSLPIYNLNRKNSESPVFVSFEKSPSLSSAKSKLSNSTPIPASRESKKKVLNSPPKIIDNSYSVSNIVNNLNSKSESNNYSQKSTQTTITPIISKSNDVSSSSLSMKEFNEVFKDLDTFIGKELNEIECRKRLGMIQKSNILKELQDRENTRSYEENIINSLKKLKDDINEIKENQKGFEEKMRKHELNQIYVKKKNDFDLNEKHREMEKKKELTAKLAPIENENVTEMLPKKVISQESFKSTVELPMKLKSQENENIIEEQEKDSLQEKEVQYVKRVLTPTLKTSTSAYSKTSLDEKLENVRDSKRQSSSITSSNSSIITESGFSRHERIKKLELEIFKEETLMIKINRILNTVNNIDERNLAEIVNIERHYLVASSRLQSALAELKKLKDQNEPIRLPPFNRKGQLFVRDIMLEIKSSYFQRTTPTRNDFLLAVLKHEDIILATNPVRIKDDVRILKFSERFSIPDIYMDFCIRLEIYGTTFWRRNTSVRDTILKKYGFVTFTLADTGNKSKRFNLIEVLQSDNIPIKSKVMMKISQKITTDIKYKGILYVKLRDIWHETTAQLNGHLLELQFEKKQIGTDFIRSQETMLLDLYNADCDAVIQFDSNRISERPFSFLLKFNHYVDVTNFYIMIAADSEDTFAEWISAINKVLILIK
ncbi:hypothetical protein PVAND_012024 [Polypedilum vanderplanki]|uniref:PH domain-containing protein n=1 Tax=Polypedilum vanderplanki TaxID=319348 RepID=A0A9J6CKC1_POLVA|nr:hypothetical protein PVAND_012024 [Polypedilum vanderplanki]